VPTEAPGVAAPATWDSAASPGPRAPLGVAAPSSGPSSAVTIKVQALAAPPPEASTLAEVPVAVRQPRRSGVTTGDQVPAPVLEERFFSDTEGAMSQPLTGEHIVVPRNSRALPIVLALGLLFGIVGTIWVKSGDAPADVEADAGVELVAGARDEPAEGAAAPAEPQATHEETPPGEQAPVVAVVPSEPAPAAGEVVDAGVVAAAVPDAVVPAPVAAPVVAPAAPPVLDAGAPPPDAAAVALSRARSELVSERFRSAVRSFREAAKLRPNDKEIRTGLGISLVMSDQGYKEAVPYLEEAVRDEPGNATAWLSLGLAYFNLGRERDARAPFEEFLKLTPNAPQARDVRDTLKMIR
jgi:TolA-binding protein